MYWAYIRCTGCTGYIRCTECTLGILGELTVLRCNCTIIAVRNLLSFIFYISTNDDGTVQADKQEGEELKDDEVVEHESAVVADDAGEPEDVNELLDEKHDLPDKVEEHSSDEQTVTDERNETEQTCNTTPSPLEPCEELDGKADIGSDDDYVDAESAFPDTELDIKPVSGMR